MTYLLLPQAIQLEPKLSFIKYAKGFWILVALPTQLTDTPAINSSNKYYLAANSFNEGLTSTREYTVP